MIEIRNLTFGYGKSRLFSDLNLSLAPGDIYGLLGKNSAGKTTLFKLIAGLRFPQGGECRVMGYVTAQRPQPFLAELFYLPEEFKLPRVTVHRYHAMFAPLYQRFNTDRFFAIIKEFGLDAHAKLNKLSYGQRKKFLIAFGLATGCRLMLLDEPTNGLDIPSKSLFRKLLAAFAPEDGAVIIATHQARELEKLIDPVVIIDSGRVVFYDKLWNVSQRLTIKLYGREPEPEEACYWEKVPGGYSVMVESDDVEDASMALKFELIISRNRVKIPMSLPPLLCYVCYFYLAETMPNDLTYCIKIH